MKSPIVFRAYFQQPTEFKMRIPAAIHVEIYQSKSGASREAGEWKARAPKTRVKFARITAQSTPATIMRQIPLVNFERQLTPWEAWDSSQEPNRKLSDSDWSTDKDGKVFLTEDYFERLKAEDAARIDAEIQRRKAEALKSSEGK